jgi:hypothetical protein
MKGRRKGDEEWQWATWTIERAKKLGLTGKSEWQKQPQTMLIARATGEICRLIAADVLYAMPYAAEELGDDVPPSIVANDPPRRTVKRAPLPELPPAPEPELTDQPVVEPEPTGDTPPELALDDGWPETARPPDSVEVSDA